MVSCNSPQPVGPLPGVEDAREDVVAEAGLRIQPRIDGPFAARAQVQQRRHQGGGADVHGHGKGVGLGIARLDVQQPTFGQHGRAAEVGRPQSGREFSQERQVDLQRPGAERPLQPQQVGQIVATLRGRKLDVAFLHGRIGKRGQNCFLG